MKNSILLLMYGAFLVVTWWTSSARGDFITVNPIKDNSIYSESDNSNALGPLFSGTTAGGAVRRALMQFDVTAIPSGAIVNSVSLGLTQIKHGSASGADSFELHRVSAAWGEGTSTGTGSGALPTTGDATWNFRQFNTLTWTPGGSFGATSGTTIIDTADTRYTFASQTGLLADVQSWVNNPSSNFGWLLKIANESNPSNAREFTSREGLLSQRPSLLVNFTAVPEPSSLVFLGAVFLVASWYRVAHRPSCQPKAQRSE